MKEQRKEHTIANTSSAIAGQNLASHILDTALEALLKTPLEATLSYQTSNASAQAS
ncbi:MAG: hypothetical protein AAFS04_13890 [Cyanobacteria bacterium J06631_9]